MSQSNPPAALQPDVSSLTAAADSAAGPDQRWRLSLAMTLYNGEAFLIEQLDSIRMQKRPFDQVVLVDDASTDQTVSMVEDYIARYSLSGWKLVGHRQNEGFVSAFRDALWLCDGDLIFLGDQDDLWYPEKTQTMVQAFASHPTLMCLASSFDLVDQDGQIIHDRLRSGCMNHNLIRRPLPEGAFSWLVWDDITGYNVSPGCTLAITRSLQQMYLYTPADMNLPHDWALVALAAMSDGLGYLDVALMGYRQHGHNTLGLSRRSAYSLRLQAARQDYAQKKALLALARASSTSQTYIERIRAVADFFEQRLNALEHRSVFELGSLLVAPQSAGFRLTLGMDLKTVLTDRAKEAEDPADDRDPGSLIRPNHPSPGEEE